MAMPSHVPTFPLPLPPPLFRLVMTYIHRITGAKKPGYGPYLVEVDGRTVTTNHSSFSRTQLFRQPIISVQGLPDGLHSVRIINRGPGFDVDTVSGYSSCR